MTPEPHHKQIDPEGQATLQGFLKVKGAGQEPGRGARRNNV
jgi:hypothetical protein